MTVHRGSTPTWPTALVVGAVALTALLITGDHQQAVAVTTPVLLAIGPRERRSVS
jgi:hypothetical protein